MEINLIEHDFAIPVRDRYKEFKQLEAIFKQ